MITTVSAPGKLILMGEYSVLFGKPALLTAIDKRVYATIIPSKKMQIETAEGKDIVEKIIKLFEKKYPKNNVGQVKIKIQSSVPMGVGLGSSAALSVALTGALLKHVKNVWNPQVINELSYEAEKINHGNPSGADNTVVTYGGLLWFRKEFEFLKSMWALPSHAYKIENIILVNTGRPKESTKEMVGMVKNYTGEKRLQTENRVDLQEKVTKDFVLALRRKNQKEIKTLINKAEENLETIGVVGEKTKQFIKEVKNVGGAAKICGAGGKSNGSGIVLCLSENQNEIKRLIKKYKYEKIEVKLGEEGVRIEKETP